MYMYVCIKIVLLKYKQIICDYNYINLYYTVYKYLINSFSRNASVKAREMHLNKEFFQSRYSYKIITL